MGSARRKAVVVTALMAYAVLLAVGPRVLGGSAGVVILVASLRRRLRVARPARRPVGGTRGSTRGGTRSRP